jgi:hypothetical protein
MTRSLNYLTIRRISSFRSRVTQVGSGGIRTGKDVDRGKIDGFFAFFTGELKGSTAVLQDSSLALRPVLKDSRAASLLLSTDIFQLFR